mgnify:FL=1
MTKFTDYPKASLLNGDETLLVAQDGAIKQCSLADIAAAAPNQAGVYPDVPLNRITIKRFAAQESATVVATDNLGMMSRIFALFFPCLIDRNSNIVAYLNGNDTTKTIDGLAATLDDYSMPCMVRLGGYYRKYEYDAVTNTKIEKYSVYPVKGYKYIRRRFFPMFAGEVEEQGGKKILTSNANKWATQNYNIQQYHEYAKNMGDNFRAIAIQDFNEYRKMFFMWKRSYNCQSFYGITGFDWNKWSATPNAESGKTGVAQPYINGVTTSIKGMEGQLAEQTFTYKDGTTQKYKPYKFLWAEGFLAGPWWLRCSGALKKADKWYVAKDINTCATWEATDDSHQYLCDACTKEGWILENFEDTMFVTQVGGSDTKGLCDYYYRADSQTTNYIPVVVGSANSGSNVGVSCLSSSNGVSYSYSDLGSALASDDPTDTLTDGTVVV